MPAYAWIGILLMILVLIVSSAILAIAFFSFVYRLLYRTETRLRRHLLKVMGRPEGVHPDPDNLWDIEIDGTVPVSPRTPSTRKGR